jgi:hypothetical protein
MQCWWIFDFETDYRSCYFTFDYEAFFRLHFFFAFAVELFSYFFTIAGFCTIDRISLLYFF